LIRLAVAILKKWFRPGRSPGIGTFVKHGVRLVKVFAKCRLIPWSGINPGETTGTSQFPRGTQSGQSELKEPFSI
jgi:hypothetical protein